MSSFGVLPGIDDLVASLRTCEVAAEASRAIGESFLSNACSRSLIHSSSQSESIGAATTVDPVQKTGSAMEMRASYLAHKNEPLADPGLKTRDSFNFLCANASERQKTKQHRNGYSSSYLTMPLRHQGNSLEAGVVFAAAASKRRRVNGTSDIEFFAGGLTSALPANNIPALQRADSVFDPSSLMAPLTGRGANALGGLRALSRQQGAVKQSRMSRRLECFRREAEEALRGQHNATVMCIFSTIDGHIRSFRGGSMSPSELDLRIMEVIDKCLPLQGDEAKAVEAVLDMATVRRLKASLQERPRNSGALLDLIALSKLCRHIPGVCFDKWNLGWIATWREHRRPVHKHFSAKKYGFFRAREFAICYRSKMTSDIPVEGADAPTSPRSIIAQGDLSPLLAPSSELLSDPATLQHLNQEEKYLTEESAQARAGPATMLTGTTGRRSSRAVLTRASEAAGGDRHQTISNAENAARSASRRRPGTAAGATQWREGPLATAAASEQQHRLTVKDDAALKLDSFISKDGWADLVARTPRVERVSFDFTNQSWIAQWKQHGKTTYRRFAVSKYGFANAHRLAVEYKSKYFKESPHSSASFIDPGTTSRDGTASASNGGVSERASASPNCQHDDLPGGLPAREGSRHIKTRFPAHRHCGSIPNNNLDVEAEFKPELNGEANLHNQHQHATKEEEVDRSGSGRTTVSSSWLSRRQQQLEKQQDQFLESIARKSAESARQIENLANQAKVVSGLLAAERDACSTVGPKKTKLDVIEALLSPSLETKEVSGCSEVTESQEAGRQREGTSTTATPTSHTHISVDSFPVNALGSPVQQQALISGTGTPPPDVEDRQMQAGQQRLQRTLLQLVQLNDQTSEYEGLQQQTLRTLQQSQITSSASVSTRSSVIHQEKAPMQGLEMLRTAINCILLDIRVNCMQEIEPSEERRQVYSDLVDYHIKFVDEVEELEALAPYSQFLASCLQGKVLPSSLPASFRTGLLQNLETLFMQHQHKIMHEEQLMHFLMMQAQQQRRLKYQQEAGDQRRLAQYQALVVQAKPVLGQSQRATRQAEQRDRPDVSSGRVE